MHVTAIQPFLFGRGLYKVMSNRIKCLVKIEQTSFFRAPWLAPKLFSELKKSPAACSIRFVKVVYKISCLKTWNSPGVSNA